MKERVITAVVLLAVVFGALFLDPTGWAVKVLILAVAFISSNELAGILKLGPMVPGSVLVLIWVLGRGLPDLHPLSWVVFMVICLCFYGLALRRDSVLFKIFFSTLWIWATILPLYILAATRSPQSWPLVLTAAIPIWCGDTAAIFVGKAFGKHQMAPEISPKKTWEGATGNFVACIGAAFALGAIFHYPWLPMLLLGLNCGIVGQAGDLFESWLKRKADMKDSGNILPGHGGVLDRIDSLMATAPISLLILQTLLPSH